MLRVGVDVGGTFTDLVALAQDGTIEVRKVVTTPDDPAVGLFRALDPLKTPPTLSSCSFTVLRLRPMPCSSAAVPASHS